MEYKFIEGVDKKVSPLFFGTASPLFIEGCNQNKLLDAAFDLGINVIDTARNYGLSEKSIGMWLKERKIREKVIILSKCAHPDENGNKRVNDFEIRKDFEESARLLGTDYIDIYLLHRDDTSVDVSVAMDTLNKMHKEGKIGAFGASNWSCERIEEANDYALTNGLIPFTVSSPHFSLARQVNDPWGGGCVSLTGPENEAAREYYKMTDMPVVCYSSLGRGLLTGKIRSDDAGDFKKYLDDAAIKGYFCDDNLLRLKRCEELAKDKGVTVAQVAMAWLYCQPLNVFAVAAMSSKMRIKENILALSLKLTDDECKYLNLEV